MKLGLTGGMGCGKSTASRFFRDHGFRAIDSDEIIRVQILAEPEVVQSIRERFGPEAVGPNGQVNRSVLASRVFADPEALQWLEEMLHPRLFAVWDRLMAEPTRADWVVEVPLLFEKRLEKWFDFTVCITTTSALQLARLSERGVSQALAEQRISKQLPLVQKIEFADFVLLNDGSLEFLRSQVERLVEQLRRAR